MNALKIPHSFAYYLPQFHVIPENEEWWGKGFTEWTKLRDARKYHARQTIQTPGELGWYDLNDVSILGQQFSLAQSHGISTFAFWHYWFGDDDLLLEGPAERLLKSDVEAEFCMAWANHDWVKRSTNQVLREQRYSQNSARHFAYLEPFFHDPRYRKIDNKPVMFIFSPSKHPHLEAFVDDMHKRAQDSGFEGMFFIFDHTQKNDAFSIHCRKYLNSTAPLKFGSSLTRKFQKLTKRFRQSRGRPLLLEYADCAAHITQMDMADAKQIPVAFPGWDTSIRHAERGEILLDNSPELYGGSLDAIQNTLAGRKEDDRFLVFKSWNEWAEGNILEPSAQHGRRFLEETAQRFVLPHAREAWKS